MRHQTGNDVNVSALVQSYDFLVFPLATFLWFFEVFKRKKSDPKLIGKELASDARVALKKLSK